MLFDALAVHCAGYAAMFESLFGSDDTARALYPSDE